MKAFPGKDTKKIYRHESGRVGIWVDTPVDNPGMDLRDYFAAKAMQALIYKYELDYSFISNTAYGFADAMIEQREENK